MKDQKKTCPSAVCEPGSQLIGIVNSEGYVDILRKSIPVDEEFVDEAKKGIPPEQRFRFANKCVQSGCHQWTPNGCGVINKIMDALNVPEDKSLPPCSIRNTCRWFYQKGPAACAICPLVITETLE